MNDCTNSTAEFRVTPEGLMKAKLQFSSTFYLFLCSNLFLVVLIFRFCSVFSCLFVSVALSLVASFFLCARGSIKLSLCTSRRRDMASSADTTKRTSSFKSAELAHVGGILQTPTNRVKESEKHEKQNILQYFWTEKTVQNCFLIPLPTRTRNVTA